MWLYIFALINTDVERILYYTNKLWNNNLTYVMICASLKKSSGNFRQKDKQGGTFHMIRGSISYHNIRFDIMNWNAMTRILDMISYVLLHHYCICRQPLPLLPGCNCDTGYTAANLQPCLWFWSCWPAHPTRRRHWLRCSAAAWRKCDCRSGRERGSTIVMQIQTYLKCERNKFVNVIYI